LLVLLTFMNAGSMLPATAVEFARLPSLPDREGFAGAFAGVSGEQLIVAGGANFPDQKPWENGRKVWYDTVFALAKPDAQWKIVGKLPRPLGYGISVTTRQGLICVGGSDSERHHAEVFLLSLQGGQLKTKPLPGLPIPLANGAGALVGETIFVFGGADQPGEQTVLNRLFALNLEAVEPRWKELEACPGKPRLMPVAAAVNGALLIAGGAALEPTNGRVARVYLRDAWRYQPGAGWKRLTDLPKPSVAAASPAPVAGSKFYIVGGDDGSLVGFQPMEKHPGFPKPMLTYDTRSDTWSADGEAPAPRATLTTTYWQDRWVLPSGEARPGVRSPEVWSFTPGSAGATKR
jgi:N-acetylneuraminic acid mutarotase